MNTGVIVQPDPTLYHTEAATAEEYIRLPEPEADEFGQERELVVYRSGRG